MPPSPEAFDGVWAKIQWADHYLQELDSRAFDISRGNRDFIGAKEDAEARQRIYYLIRDPIIPVGFPLLAGTVIQSLRSALDHLAFALCVTGPGGQAAADANVKQIHFPITAGDANDYGADNARRVIVRLSKPGVEQALDAVEPYKGGAGELLVRLNLLNNIDKHRLLLTVALQRPWRDPTNAEAFDPMTAKFLRVAKGLITGIGLNWPSGGAPLKAGDEVFREPLDSKTDEKVSLTFPIALNEPQVLPIEPVGELLHNMADFVRRLVPAFNAFV